MSAEFHRRIADELRELEARGLFKREHVLSSRQGPEVVIEGRKPALNFCANNYLGLSGDYRISQAAAVAMERWGAGTSSVRFICGTLAIHKELEHEVADYLGFEDSILFAAAFDANGGVFEPLLSDGDAIVSDSLNHASIIDGIRLAKAKRFRFANGDMDDLERQLRRARSEGARTILVVTDGVFSMDGYIAKLGQISALAKRYDSLLMVDDSHATGVIGASGRGSFAHCGVAVDILTGTFGKALGGAMGGFICASRDVVALLRQRARPYLFSNALAPAICGATLKAIEISRSAEGDLLRARLSANAEDFRARMTSAGFDLPEGEHPIVPVMLGDAEVAQAVAQSLLRQGILATGFFYPVVPLGQARIRVQLSAAHLASHIEHATAAFCKARMEA